MSYSQKQLELKVRQFRRRNNNKAVFLDRSIRDHGESLGIKIVWKCWLAGAEHDPESSLGAWFETSTINELITKVDTYLTQKEKEQT